MKLIDLLVQELPKRGGWPEGAEHAWRDPDGEIRFRNGGCKPDFYPESQVDIECRVPGFSFEDEPLYIVTREQYEAALAAAQHPVWNGEGLPPVGCEFEYGKHRTKVKCLGIGHQMIFASKGDPDDEEGDFEEFMLSIMHSEFHPVRSEADKKRDNAIAHMEREWESVTMVPAVKFEVIYDAIAEGKIPGVKTF